MISGLARSLGLLLHRDRGQAVAEYAFILALVSISLILLLVLFEKQQAPWTWQSLVP